MKLFHLIKQDAVHIDQKKVIPSEEFAQLLDAKSLVEKIHADTLEFKKQAVEEAEKIKERAYQEGFQKGQEQWVHQINDLESHFQLLKTQFESTVATIALSVARKILGRELEIRPEAMIDIIRSNLKTMSQFKRIIIYVNKADLKLVEENRPELRRVIENAESFSIIEKPEIESGGFMIESEGGIINLATADKLWKPIEIMFEQFLKKEQSHE